MPEQTIDFDSNPPVATSEYDHMAQMALPGYEAMHTMTKSILRSHLPELTNLLIVGAGSGMELVEVSKGNSQWQMLGVDPSSNMNRDRPTENRAAQFIWDQAIARIHT